MKTITVYVPISRYIQKEYGPDDHVIAEYANAVSNETYERMCSEKEENITKKVEPVINDIKALLHEIETDDFDVDIDVTKITIFHSYCPTLNRDQVTFSGKELKSMTDNEKIKSAKDKYIEILNNEINDRLSQRQMIIDEFVYHPILIDIEEFEKMKNDTFVNDSIPFIGDVNESTNPMTQEVTEEGIILTDNYTDPVDNMDY